MSGWWLLMLLMGCAPADPAALYLAAAADPTDPRACEGIADVRLYGECVSMTAAELAATSGEATARARCGRLPADNPWRGECYFLLSDTLGATGPQALSLCSEAGGYRDRCAGHALEREGRALLNATPLGEEDAAVEKLLELGAVYFPDPPGGDSQVSHLLVEHLASRDFDQPFRRATCGSAPKSVCAAAFVARLRFADRDAGHAAQLLRSLCARQPVTSATAEALGLPGWAADADDIAAASVARICGPGRQRR
jgi:hypothetical protein